MGIIFECPFCWLTFAPIRYHQVLWSKTKLIVGDLRAEEVVRLRIPRILPMGLRCVSDQPLKNPMEYLATAGS